MTLQSVVSIHHARLAKLTADPLQVSRSDSGGQGHNSAAFRKTGKDYNSLWGRNIRVSVGGMGSLVYTGTSRG